MASPQEPKFDPNAALRDFNAYFGTLRKDYGESAIRGAGFTPRDLSLLQASLRKLQMDPNATPEQHRQAYQQARDALAQKITTPLAAARPTPSAPPEVEVRGVMPSMPEVEVRGVMPSMPETVRPVMPEMVVRPPTPMPVAMIGNGALRPTAAQLAAYQASGSKGHWNSDTGAFEEFAARPTPVVPEVMPPPPIPLHVDPGPRTPVPSATDYISGLNGSGSNEIVATQPVIREIKSQPKPNLGDMLQAGIGRLLPPTQTTPSTAPGILPGIMPMQPAAPSMNTQPGADFDRNVARQIFDSEFRTLRDKYGDDGLRAAGLTPRTLSALQAPLTNVQRDNTISYDQSSAALEDALQQLRGYNFGGAQPAAPAPAAAQGMAMGGLINKYYR
jgi:hypothetical protein